jgi:hypothetical protein
MIKSAPVTFLWQSPAKFPNHLSIHAGGMLISDKPIYQYTATELPPKFLHFADRYVRCEK